MIIGISRRTGRHRRAIAMPIAFVLVFVAAVTSWAFWTSTSTSGSNGAAAATTVNQGPTPTATVSGTSVIVSWSATSLANGGPPASGYTIRRYNTSNVVQTIGAGCEVTITALTCTENNVPSGQWKYSVIARFSNHWSGPESAKSNTVSLDTDGPTNAITLSNVSGGAYKAPGSDTVYYKGNAAGSFTLTNTLTDPNSGPASSQTAALGGTSTGWSHTPSTVSTPTGGPYVSNPFSWTDPTTSAPTEVVKGRDVANNQSDTTLTFTNDSSAPSLGTISYTDGYTTGTSITVTFTAGNDSGSGVNASAGRIKRSVAPLVDGVCGSYVTSNNYFIAPTSPVTDTNVATGYCYTYQYVTTDNVGNPSFSSSASVAKMSYNGTVTSEAGLLSQWRLGEAATSVLSADSFAAGAAGALLSARTGETAATWTAQAANSATAELATWTTTVRGQAIRRSNTIGTATYYTSAAPSSADYRVGADVVVKSLLGGEIVGVVGRLDTAGTAAGTFYTARYDVTAAQWQLYPVVNGVVQAPVGAAYSQTLTAGQVYHVSLDMSGTTISLLVDGVVRVTGTNSQITAAGRGGVRLSNGANAGDAATGLSLDNFQMTPGGYPRAVDSVGSNTGDYFNGPALGVAGAIGGGGSTNTAAQFDGVNDYVRVPAPVGLPVGAATRSVELWFKTTSTGRNVLYTYGSKTTNAGEFGMWLSATGSTITAWGVGAGNDKTWTGISPALNNGQWHQLVTTYDGTGITVYVDGVSRGTQAVTRATIIDQYGFSIGGVLAPNDANTGGWFNGSIDEVSFYTTAMSQAAITGHYQLGAGGGMDATGPTGGSVDATGLVGTGSRYTASTTLSIGFSAGTDASGIRPTGAQLTRATATLTSTGGANGVCGTFGGYEAVATDPVSPITDTVADQACYRYEYKVEDNYGNARTYQSGDIKVDTTLPTTPTLAFSNFFGTYWSGSGSTVYYRSSASMGNFRVTASSSDSASGVASYTFPSLGTNWTSTPVSPGVNTYAWSGAPAAPGTVNITATNNAGANSGNAPFSLTADNTAPGVGTVTYPNGSAGGATLSVSFTTGTDGGAGLGTRLLQRAAAPRAADGTCGTYLGYATIPNGTNPPSSPVADTLTPGFCYKYQYTVYDNVGNFHNATSTDVVYAPFGAYWAYNAGTGTTAVDSSGNANTATLGAGAGWTAGKVGTNALTVNGTATGVASAPNPVIDTSQSYTVAGWVNFTTITGNHAIAAIEGTNVSGFYLKRASTGMFNLSQPHGDSTGAGGVRVDGFTPVVGTWYHVAGVYNMTAGTIELFVNGVSQGTAAASPTPFKALGATVVGRSRYNAVAADFTNGAIDEVRFYDRVLTQAELTALANPDVAAPTGGSVTPTGLVGTGSRYSTSTTINLTLAQGTDPSGIAASGNLLHRATSALTNGTCGSFTGAYTTLVATDPGASAADTVTAGACYSYRYTVADAAGNTAEYFSGDIKVDTSAPAAPSLAHSLTTNTFWNGSGTTVYYRSAANTGSFTTTASATDAQSGIASYTFPALGTNWTSTPGSPGVNTYSWSGAPAAPGTTNVTATNNATGTSAGSPFTLTADDTAPSAGTVTYTGGTQSSTTVSVAFTTGTDGGSGLGTRLLQRATAPLTGTTCGTYLSFATITGGTNPGASPVVDTVTAGSCYKYQYVVRDRVGNEHIATSANEVKVNASYATTIAATSGLLNWFRLGEDVISTDTFAGTTGAVLSTRTGEVGATWTRWAADTTTAVLTNEGRLRKTSATTGVTYYTSATPSSANYLVEADVHVKSIIATDYVAVQGRIEVEAQTNVDAYYARYNTKTGGTAGAWELVKSVGGTGTVIGTFSQALTAGTTYRLGLDMTGTTIRVLVNGAEVISVVDSGITGPGRGGVRFGASTSGSGQSDTTGLHLDNFTIVPQLTDSKGTNTGDYFGGVLLGVAGAINGDSDSAASFDGVNDYASVTRTIGDDFSIEFWFKSMDGGSGTGVAWWNGAGMVDAEVSGAANDFGVSLLANGSVVGGVGTPDMHIVSPTGYDDGTWHHVVFTRAMGTRALQLYVDGTLVGTNTGSTSNSLNTPATISFGRLNNGTNYYDGSLDEVAFYNVVLSQATVTSHYNAGQ